MPALIATVHATFATLESEPELAVEFVKLTLPVPIRKSVTDDHIVSRKDGKRYQTLERHLAMRGLMPAACRQKRGLPHDHPMTAPAYRKRRPGPTFWSLTG